MLNGKNELLIVEFVTYSIDVIGQYFMSYYYDKYLRIFHIIMFSIFPMCNNAL